MKPGNFVLIRTARTWKLWKCWDTWLVWAAQRFAIAVGRFGKNVPAAYAKFTHTAFIISDTELIQADEQGVHKSPITDLDGVDYVVVDPGLSDEDVKRAIAYLLSCQHEAYAFIRFVSLGLVYLTACWLSFGLDAHKTCSGLVSSALEPQPRDKFPHDPSIMAPVNLAIAYNVQG